MKTSNEFLPLLEPLAALQRLIEKFDQRGVLIGGIAASLLGKPRLTADIDALFLLSIDDIPAFLEAARLEGFEPRIKDVQDFAAENRVILLVHRASDINVDVSMGILPFEQEVVKQSAAVDLGPISLTLPTPEHLIIMKAVAHRPQDLLDIQALIESNPGVDKVRIREWVTEFASLLEAPELWDDIADYFSS